MKYQVILPKKVQKDLEKIDSRFLPKIQEALKLLAQEPFCGKKLEGERKGQWSYRVWPYRIIYEIHKHELVVLIVRIGHRQGIYN